MRSNSWLYLLLISILVLAGCAPVSRTIRQTEQVRSLSPTNLPATKPFTPALTPTLSVTMTPSPTATQTQLVTLLPESVKETVQPLLIDPMNCAEPCFLGIAPGKTSMDEVRAFFSPLGFSLWEGTDPNSGMDFYTVRYEDSIDRDSRASLFFINNLVENIVITLDLTGQKADSPREWIVYAPETLIEKFGQPSRVKFGLDLGEKAITTNMILYFDSINLIAVYHGVEEVGSISSQFCPSTYPFDLVHILMGENPPDPPQYYTVSLQRATSVTVEQFTQQMLEDPEYACFTLNWDVFQE